MAIFASRVGSGRLAAGPADARGELECIGDAEAEALLPVRFDGRPQARQSPKVQAIPTYFGVIRVRRVWRPAAGGASQ